MDAVLRRKLYSFLPDPLDLARGFNPGDVHYLFSVTGEIRMKRNYVLGVAVLGLAVLAPSLLASNPAVAQAPPLPQVSPSERMIGDANRALRAQELRQQQQNTFQFEINALRAEQLRQQQFPRLTGPTVNPHCPPGAQGC
jgi:hypothetical protein